MNNYNNKPVVELTPPLEFLEVPEVDVSDDINYPGITEDCIRDYGSDEDRASRGDGENTQSSCDCVTVEEIIAVDTADRLGFFVKEMDEILKDVGVYMESNPEAYTSIIRDLISHCENSYQTGVHQVYTEEEVLVSGQSG